MSKGKIAPTLAVLVSLADGSTYEGYPLVTAAKAKQAKLELAALRAVARAAGREGHHADNTRTGCPICRALLRLKRASGTGRGKA